MAKMQCLQAEVAALPEGELRRFHAWFENFCAERWDQETENDYAEGKLESLAAEALAEYKAGKCKQLQEITPSSRFWECYYAPPPAIQQLADADFALLKRDPRHPSLHLKQIGNLWSVRIGLHHGALGIAVADGILWFWIGNHRGYDRLVNRG